MSNKPKKTRADWTSWILQYFFGLAVGAGLAWCLFISVREDMPDRSLPEWTMEFCVGSGLFFAGLAAFYGDKLWLDSVYRCATPDSHENSTTSANLAAISFVLGVGIMIAVVLKWLAIVA